MLLLGGYLERDVRTITNVRDPMTFRRFLSLLASRHGQVLNKTDLAHPSGLGSNHQRVALHPESDRSNHSPAAILRKLRKAPHQVAGLGQSEEKAHDFSLQFDHHVAHVCIEWPAQRRWGDWRTRVEAKFYVIRSQSLPPRGLRRLIRFRSMAEKIEIDRLVRLSKARALLLRLKKARTFRLTFIRDEHDVSHLPGWVRSPKQITDGHLGKLASANGAALATLDENIPGSYLIPG